MSQYLHAFSQLRPRTDADRRAQRTLAAADQLLSRVRPPRPTNDCTSAEAELMRYMDEMRTHSGAYGHAGAVLRRRDSAR